jgi:hypothetical protein
MKETPRASSAAQAMYRLGVPNPIVTSGMIATFRVQVS